MFDRTLEVLDYIIRKFFTVIWWILAGSMIITASPLILLFWLLKEKDKE